MKSVQIPYHGPIIAQFGPFYLSPTCRAKERNSVVFLSVFFKNGEEFSPGFILEPTDISLSNIFFKATQHLSRVQAMHDKDVQNLHDSQSAKDRINWQAVVENMQYHLVEFSAALRAFQQTYPFVDQAETQVYQQLTFPKPPSLGALIHYLYGDSSEKRMTIAGQFALGEAVAQAGRFSFHPLRPKQDDFGPYLTILLPQTDNSVIEVGVTSIAELQKPEMQQRFKLCLLVYASTLEYCQVIAASDRSERQAAWEEEAQRLASDLNAITLAYQELLDSQYFVVSE